MLLLDWACSVAWSSIGALGVYRLTGARQKQPQTGVQNKSFFKKKALYSQKLAKLRFAGGIENLPGPTIFSI